ncbi:MAG: hypothetical protein NTW87_02655 [Planctomycetota bacterium]|nr:hypothetical protein [Planctomycetota bacterium]
MTNTTVSQWSVAAICVAALLLTAPVWAAGAGNARQGQGRGEPGQRIDQALERISERIKDAQERLAKHPNSPEAVKTAAGKLISDLNAAKALLEKAKAAVQSHDRNSVQGVFAELKALHETIRADFETLKSAVEAARQQMGRGGPQGNPKAPFHPKDGAAF